MKKIIAFLVLFVIVAVAVLKITNAQAQDDKKVKKEMKMECCKDKTTSTCCKMSESKSCDKAKCKEAASDSTKCRKSCSDMKETMKNCDMSKCKSMSGK